MKTTNIRQVSLGVRPNGPRRSATTLLSSLTLVPLFIAACGFPRPQPLDNTTPGDAGGSDSSGNSGVSDASDGPGDTGGMVPPPDPGTTIHVSPTGDDANDGLLTPVKTLKHAIGLATANPTLTRIVLATGTYSTATGELFPYTTPNTVAIAGPAGGGALLVGDGTAPAMTIDTGTLQDLDLQNFTTAISATGTASLKNIRILTSTIAVQAETAAKLTVDHLDIAGTAGACSTGIVLNGAAQLSAATLTTRNLGSTLNAVGHSAASIADAQVTGDSACSASVLKLSSDRSFVLNNVLLQGGNVGIECGPETPGSGVMMFTNVTVRGMKFQALGIGNATLVMTGGELSHADKIGPAAVNCSNASMSISNVDLIQNDTFALFAIECTLRMRGCTVTGNHGGLLFEAEVAIDLGTGDSPGSNILQNNNGPSVFVMDSDPLGSTIVNAVGNVWNPLTQLANGQGGYDGVDPAQIPKQGNNFNLANNLSIRL